MQSVHCEQILEMVNECEVVIANTSALIAECCRLRHQVFCLEKGIFKPRNGDQETDAFDEHAHHVLLIHRESGQAVGTTRIVPPSDHVSVDRFPMTRAFAPGILNGLPPHSAGEISRFAISKQRRTICGASMMVRLGLMQGIVRLSGELGLTHWCAIMEPKLVRLFQLSGIEFHDLGPPVEYFGWRKPVYADIKLLSVQLNASSWEVWNYVSQGGTLWKNKAVQQVRARQYA
jgi:N-acyl-L-homoserine lactone synthetase